MVPENPKLNSGTFSVNEKLEQNNEWDIMESQLDKKIETIVKGMGL